MINWITAGIAVIGLILSLFTALKDIYRQKIRFDVAAIDYRSYQSRNVMQLLLVISNFSSKPLSITFISVNGATCELERKKIHNDPTAWNGITTSRFPLCISADGCIFTYLEFVNFPHKPLTPETNLTLEIQTTKKRVLKNVLLGQPSHYLRTMDKFLALQNPQRKTNS